MFKNIYVLATIVLVISIALAEVDFTGEFFFIQKERVNLLGESGIIASFLMLSVEFVFRNAQAKATAKIVEKINHNIFHAVYQRNLPKGVVDEIEKTVFKSDVFRTNHELCYTLEDIDQELDDETDAFDHLSSEIQSSFTLENISGRPVNHDLRINLELPIDPKWRKYCKLLELEIDNVNVKDSPNTKINMTSEQLEITHSLQIPEGGKVKIRSKAKQVKRTTDMEVWTSFLPSDGMRLQVITANAKVDAFAVANHREKLSNTHDNSTLKIWNLNEYILPFQSVTFWWKAKSESVNPPT